MDGNVIGNFENTTLWQAAFGPRKNDATVKPRDDLRAAYLAFRERVEDLTARIATDMPELTIHDISHLDALWETASIIAGPDYRLNAAEAFVLGGAFLLHDAGMSCASYPGGVVDLQKTVEWQDTVASLLREAGTESPTPSDVLDPPSEVRAQAIPMILRILHAKHAEELATVSWSSSDDQSVQFLIQDDDLRVFYGPMIGRIAHSHWWSASELEHRLPKLLGAGPGVPQEWSIEPIKIACLLRVADAAHIDARRAPRFLRSLTKPRGHSADHWNFQEKISKVVLQGDSLVYTSGPSFELADADSWWICFDTIRLIDRELRDADAVLQDLNLPRLAARRVKGATSAPGLAEFIRTHRWRPIDAELKVSDVPSLVRLLGGEHLYGKDSTAPVRELIQNAADAVRARCLLENRSENWGEVRVSLRGDGQDTWLDVEDNGVGMSEAVLTGPLLDFGKSFWTSDLLQHELPGLQAKGMKAVGRYGIGFFSSFMLGDVVRVFTRRYNSSETRVLDFRSGLALRPILREAEPHEHLVDPGTRVSVKLKAPPQSEHGLLSLTPRFGKPSQMSLQRMVARVCPCPITKVLTSEFGNTALVASANDWHSLEPSELLFRSSDRIDRVELDRIAGTKTYSAAVRELRDKDGHVHGRACIYPNRWLLLGWVTVGGFVSVPLGGFAGILTGETDRVARNHARPTVPLGVLATWATEQAYLISALQLPDSQKFECARIILACGGDPADLPIVEYGQNYYDTQKLQELVSGLDRFLLGEPVRYDPDLDDVHPNEFDNRFSWEVDMGIKRDDIPELLASASWPSCLFREDQDEDNKQRSCDEIVRCTLVNAWGAMEEEQVEMVIGSVSGKAIRRRVTVLSRGGANESSSNGS
jgi:hypothetical protein